MTVQDTDAKTLVRPECLWAPKRACFTWTV